MTMLTVSDLARDLKVKNEDLLKELTTLGFEVEGPESPLETEDTAELRAKLVEVLPKREVIEKRIKPTVIRRRVKKKPALVKVEAEVEKTDAAQAEPREEPAAEKKAPAPAKAAAKGRATKAKKPVSAKIIEKAPAPEVPEKPPAPPKAKKTSQKTAAKPAATEQVVVETPIAAEPPGEVEIPEKAAEEDKAHQEKPAKRKKKKEKKMQPAQIIGRVELKKEPPPEPPQPRRPHVASPPRPAPIGAGPDFPGPSVPPPDDDKRKKKKKDRKGKDHSETSEENKTKVRRRKEVLLRKDLYDQSPRSGRMRGRKKKTRQRKTEVTTPKASKRRVKIPEVVPVSVLAHKMSVKGPEVIHQLLNLGVTASMNEGVDYDTASIVASEFGYEAEPAVTSEVDLLPILIRDTEENLVPRPPVITVMGHVDHGKTSLLDTIRSSHVTDQEAGGITQHIGAYKLKLDKGELVFLDTPGHEAFTTMRARGAQVTDFVVLVVAADDGVMDQTKEAINHAKAAEVPIVVAVNKIDKPEADRDKTIRELSEFGLIPESWGGDTLFTYLSAKTGEGVDEFLDLILLQAELMELKANPNKTASGTIVEARLDKGKGAVATVLISAGTLELGDPFLTGTHHGKVRSMVDHEGRPVKKALPATPVEVRGFSGVPEAGEQFVVVKEEKVARQIGSQRREKHRQQEISETGPVSLEDLLARIQEGEPLELNVIVKGDVHGSVEAINEALLGIPAEQIKVNIVHSGVGTVTESDVMLAGTTGAIIIGFNVRPNPQTTQMAEEKKIDLRLYSVIYEVISDVRKAMEGLLAPIQKEVVVGRAEVRETFSVSRIGIIAGCHVASGKIERSNTVRLLRDDVPVYEGKMASMKRFQDDVKEVVEGFECGIVLENYKDIKIGDVIEAFAIEQEAAKLE